MKKRWKVLFSSLLGVGLLLLGGVWWLASQQHQPAAAAANLATTAKKVETGLTFPGDPQQPLVIFYQGAFVEAASYSLWANALSEAGYGVYLLQKPFSLPLLAQGQTTAVLQAHPDRDYVMGGHSLGGVMASRFAHQQLAAGDPHLKGIFFLASYPDEKGRLDASRLPVLSITASNDKVLNQKSYDKARRYLPKTADEQEITGGNHAGFGDYGPQAGDGQREITVKEQNQQVAEKIKAWLETIQ